MQLSDILKLYARHEQCRALATLLKNDKIRKASLSGFTQSAIAMNFAAIRCKQPLLFIMRDADEAGYLYQDLCNLGMENVLFFPSSYKRAVKFGQRDAASEVMRAETLIALTENCELSTENC